MERPRRSIIAPSPDSFNKIARGSNDALLLLAAFNNESIGSFSVQATKNNRLINVNKGYSFTNMFIARSFVSDVEMVVG